MKVSIISRGSIGAALVLLLSIAIGCGEREASVITDRPPQAAKVALDDDGTMHLSPGDRCPLCAMPVSEHAKLVSAIQLRNGSTFYFCGTGCMIKSWLHPEVYLNAQKTQLRRSLVKEYFEGALIDGLEARFVAGSDVIGPMGPALVPLKNDQDVTTFKNRHGGETVFRLGELNDQRWREITGKNALGGRTKH